MRKQKPRKRYYMPDSRYGDEQVTLFVNNLMMSGKKSTSFKVFYDAMDIIEEKTKESGYDTWKKAMANVAPGVEVRSKRIGGATFQIPIEVRPQRRVSLTMKWIIQFARSRGGKSMADKLANELIAGSKGEGGAYKKKEDTHRMADANKAFSHFRA